MVLDAALLLLCAVSAVTVSVPPPTDVTLSCQNLNTTVSWNHAEEAKTRFLVNVKGTDAKPREIETWAREVDLTRFLWESSESCMDLYYVTVTAVRDGNQSAAVESESISFNRLETPRQKCLLDFPPVELTVRESEATVSFQNPLMFYEELKRVAGQDDGVSFKYSVVTRYVTLKNETFPASCSKDDPVCRRDVWFSEGEEPRVALEGRLCTRNCLGEMTFRTTELIFQNNWTSSGPAGFDPDALTVSLALMLSVLLFVVVVVTVSICKVRGWTMDKKDPETPRVLVFEDERKPMILPPFPQGGTVEPVLAVIPDCPTAKTDDSEDDELSQRRRASFSLEEGYQDGGLSEDSNQGPGSGPSGADGSERTECVSMSSEEEDECARGYDRQHRLLDMGDGDMVTSYGNV